MDNLTGNKDVEYTPVSDSTIDISGTIKILDEAKETMIQEAHEKSKTANPEEIGSFAYRKATVDNYVKKLDQGLVKFLKPKEKEQRKIYEVINVKLSVTTMVYTQVENLDEKTKDTFIDAIYEQLQLMTLHNFMIILDKPSVVVAGRISGIEARVDDAEAEITTMKKQIESDHLMLRWIAKWVLEQIRKLKAARYMGN